MRLISVTTTNDKQFDLGKLTILVGPNNVGKSQLLRDILNKLSIGRDSRTVIIKEILPEHPPKFSDLTYGLRKEDDKNDVNTYQLYGISSNLRGSDGISVQKDYEELYGRVATGMEYIQGYVGKLKVAYLDASSRLEIARSAESGYPNSAPSNLLQALYLASSKDNYEELQNVFKTAFDMNIRFDYSALRILTFRIAKEFGQIPVDPKDAFQILDKYQKLDDQGDGFRSFVGVVLGILLAQDRIILLDEPDAFLHPSQAKVLGNWIANQSSKITGQVLIATHNSDFVTGILSSNSEVTIYRLNRLNDETSFTKISAESTMKLAKSPLLSSQPVLESIFHRRVIVCEADSDRCFYQYVATKVLSNHDTLFIHAHSKQTIKDVVIILKEASIPTQVIVDLDILNSRDDFRNLVESLKGSISSSLFEKREKIANAVNRKSEEDILSYLKDKVMTFIKGLEQQQFSLAGARSRIENIRKNASRWSTIKVDGLQGLPSEVRDDAEKLIEEARSFGLFIVPVGELEQWLKLSANKKNWIVHALSELVLGNCPTKLRDFVSDILSSSL